jgi:hypothetical protein
MKTVLERWWRTIVVITFSLFAVSIVSGLVMYASPTEQWQYYEAGRNDYLALQFEDAKLYFRRSLAAYDEAARSGPSFFAAPASLEMEELAQHFIALGLVKKGTEGDMKDGIVAFKDGLKMTTEKALDDLTPTAMGFIAPNANSPEDFANAVKKIRHDRELDQQNLEILFNNQPRMAEQEGKGKGKTPAKDKKDGAPGGNKSGKDDRNQL